MERRKESQRVKGPALRNQDAARDVTTDAKFPRVGDVIEVLWEGPNGPQWYSGKLLKRVKKGHFRFVIAYEDGDEVDQDIDEDSWRFEGTGEADAYSPGQLRELADERRPAPKRPRENGANDKVSTEKKKKRKKMMTAKKEEEEESKKEGREEKEGKRRSVRSCKLGAGVKEGTEKEKDKTKEKEKERKDERDNDKEKEKDEHYERSLFDNMTVYDLVDDDEVEVEMVSGPPRYSDIGVDVNEASSNDVTAEQSAPGENESVDTRLSMRDRDDRTDDGTKKEVGEKQLPFRKRREVYKCS